MSKEIGSPLWLLPVLVIAFLMMIYSHVTSFQIAPEALSKFQEVAKSQEIIIVHRYPNVLLGEKHQAWFDLEIDGVKKRGLCTWGGQIDMTCSLYDR